MSEQPSSSNAVAASPWHAKHPAPKLASVPVVTREQLLEMLQQDSLDKPPSFLLVDLRRMDHQGGTIKGSLNLPAETQHPAIPDLYRLAKAAQISQVIWYCGSSRGRGTRAACWFQDYIDQMGDSTIQSYTLEGGIKRWAAGGPQFIEHMSEYEASSWA